MHTAATAHVLLPLERCCTSAAKSRTRPQHADKIAARCACIRTRKQRRLSLVRHLDDLAEHDGGVAVEEGDAAEALAVLEAVDDERLRRLEHDLRHLVRLHAVRLLQLLATRLLAHLQKCSACCLRDRFKII